VRFQQEFLDELNADSNKWWVHDEANEEEVVGEQSTEPVTGIYTHMLRTDEVITTVL